MKHAVKQKTQQKAKQNRANSMKFLALFIAINASTLAINHWLTSFSVHTWYALLNKPGWTPPNWVFPVVWPLLYLLMALAMWTIWEKKGFRKSAFGFMMLFIQLGLNSAWSGTFFVANEILLALGIIIATWLLLLLTLPLIARYSVTAMQLLLPYLLWLTYAMALNGTIYVMNPQS